MRLTQRCTSLLHTHTSFFFLILPEHSFPFTLNHQLICFDNEKKFKINYVGKLNKISHRHQPSLQHVVHFQKDSLSWWLERESGVVSVCRFPSFRPSFDWTNRVERMGKGKKKTISFREDDKTKWGNLTNIHDKLVSCSKYISYLYYLYRFTMQFQRVRLKCKQPLWQVEKTS